MKPAHNGGNFLIIEPKRVVFIGLAAIGGKRLTQGIIGSIRNCLRAYSSVG
jgi:hypothetical protein